MVTNLRLKWSSMTVDRLLECNGSIENPMEELNECASYVRSRGHLLLLPILSCMLVMENYIDWNWLSNE